MLVRTVAMTLIAFLGVAPFAIGDSCAGPQALEFRARFHPDAETYKELGKWFGDHKQYSCAIEALRTGLGVQPDSADLSYLLGLTLYISGDAKGAIAPLRMSLEAKPNGLEPHLILAAAYAELQVPDKAKAEYEAALHLDPRSTTALEGLSKILLASGNYLEVIEILHSAPLNETLAFNLAQAYAKSHMLKQAAQVLEPALRANPSSLRLTSLLATVYVNLALYRDALHLGEKADRLHPNNLEAQDLYLSLLVLNHDLGPARVLSRSLLAAHPHDFEALYLSGIVEREDARYDLAKQHLEQAIAINPDHFNSRYNLGLVLVDLNDPAGAKVQLEKALALGAGTSETKIRYQLSLVLRTLGDHQRAEEQSSLTEKELQQADANRLAQGRCELAEAALKTGDVQKAVGLYREAVEATPDNALTNLKLALALDRVGDTKAEYTVLEKVIQIAPTFADAQYQLGYLASRQGDFSAAEEHFRQAVHSAPGYADAWLSLAATLGEESRYSEALDAVANAIRLDRNNPQALQLRQDLRHMVSQH